MCVSSDLLSSVWDFKADCIMSVALLVFSFSAVGTGVFYIYYGIEWNWLRAFSPPTPPVLMGNVRHVLSVETAYCIWATVGLSLPVF